MKSAHIIKRCMLLAVVALLLFSLACGSPHITGVIKMESYEAVKKAFKDDERFIFPELSGFIPEDSVISYEVWREDPLDNTSPFNGCLIYGDGLLNGAKVEFGISSFAGQLDSLRTDASSVNYNGVNILHFISEGEQGGMYNEAFVTYIGGCEYTVRGTCNNRPASESDYNDMREAIMDKIYPVICSIIDEAQKN